MKKIILLGGNVEGIPAILEAKKKYQVILVDKNRSAPGFKHSHLRINESIFDFKSIIKVLKKKKYKQIVGVMCASTDAPMSVYKISNYLNIKYYSHKTAYFFSNKYIMKCELKKKKIPIPWFKKITRAIEIKKILKYKKKIVIKPCDSRGGRGVFLIDIHTKNIEYLFNLSKSFSKLNYLIVEEFIDGQQFSTETIIHQNKYHTPGFCRRNYKGTKKYLPNLIENGGDQPVIMKKHIKDKIISLIERTGKASGLKKGILKGDIVLAKNKEPYIIEVASRLSGGWFSSHQIPHATGVNIINAALKIACSEEINLDDLKNKYQKPVGVRYFFPRIGILKKIIIPKNLIKDSNIIKLMFFKKKGNKITNIESHPDRVGFVILKEKTRSRLIQKLNRFSSNIKFVIKN